MGGEWLSVVMVVPYHMRYGASWLNEALLVVRPSYLD
jgi:hypothetical protein